MVVSGSSVHPKGNSEERGGKGNLKDARHTSMSFSHAAERWNRCFFLIGHSLVVLWFLGSAFSVFLCWLWRLSHRSANALLLGRNQLVQLPEPQRLGSHRYRGAALETSRSCFVSYLLHCSKTFLPYSVWEQIHYFCEKCLKLCDCMHTTTRYF